ncbi:MAG TPA: hypothetical protein VFA18_14490 [Gemmataceae bacterium]|nr:hypothetical protein [Gemmataceae bacterium]
MKRVLAWLPASLVALATTGCGTVCNLAGGVAHPDKEPRIYGGIQRDVEVLESLLTDQPPKDGLIQPGEGQGGAILAGCIICLCVADPILSFVGDTLTLPITIPLQQRRNARDAELNRPVAVPSNPNELAPVAPPHETPTSR